MQVGDLVKTEGKVYIDGKAKRWLGLVVEKAQPERWMVLWNNGQVENMPDHLLELVACSR